MPQQRGAVWTIWVALRHSAAPDNDFKSIDNLEAPPQPSVGSRTVYDGMATPPYSPTLGDVIRITANGKLTNTGTNNHTATFKLTFPDQNVTIQLTSTVGVTVPGGSPSNVVPFFLQYIFTFQVVDIGGERCQVEGCGSIVCPPNIVAVFPPMQQGNIDLTLTAKVNLGISLDNDALTAEFDQAVIEYLDAPSPRGDSISSGSSSGSGGPIASTGA
jgi:hypothetical protein